MYYSHHKKVESGAYEQHTRHSQRLAAVDSGLPPGASVLLEFCPTVVASLVLLLERSALGLSAMLPGGTTDSMPARMLGIFFSPIGFGMIWSINDGISPFGRTIGPGRNGFLRKRLRRPRGLGRGRMTLWKRGSGLGGSRRLRGVRVRER